MVEVKRYAAVSANGEFLIAETLIDLEADANLTFGGTPWVCYKLRFTLPTIVPVPVTIELPAPLFELGCNVDISDTPHESAT